MTSATITIDGVNRDLQKVAVRHMNFDQHWRTPGVRDLAYELTLPHSCLRRVLDAELEEFVEDARKFPDDGLDFEIALRECDWPSVDKILEDPKLREAALSYFALEILQEVLYDCNGSDGWILNTIRHTSYDEEHLRIEGLSAKASELRAYQDI
jgi:hypothetical protein